VKLFSVTVEYEDEREGEWVETYAVLALDEHSAGEFARAHVEDTQPFTDYLTVTVNGEWHGEVEPRLIASLMLDPEFNNPVWREIR